jgi:hypothetical protein
LRNWVNDYRSTHAGDEPPLSISDRARLRELGWYRAPRRCRTYCGVRAANCRIAVTESLPVTSVAHAVQHQNNQQRMPQTPQPARIGDLPQPVEQRLDLFSLLPGMTAGDQVVGVPGERRMHQVRCPCGRAHVAEPPSQAGTGNTHVYGPNLRALVVYLLVFQHVPVERCVRLIADLTGATVSAGFVHKALARCAAILTDVMKSIKALIKAAAALGHA